MELQEIAVHALSLCRIHVAYSMPSPIVHRWPRDQIEVFCITNLINCALESDEENIVFDFHCATDDSSMPAAFELIHMFLEQPVWEVRVRHDLSLRAEKRQINLLWQEGNCQAAKCLLKLGHLDPDSASGSHSPQHQCQT